MMSWWWSGAIGAASKGRCRSEADIETASGHQSVGLVIGVTGVVGNSLAEILPLSDTPGGPWKVYGVARRPQPGWSSTHQVEFIQCDVSNRIETIEKLSVLKDVTHVFYVTWFGHLNEDEQCVQNGEMFKNVLEAVVPNAVNLKHVCLQTGLKQYMGPYVLLGKIQSHETPFREEMPRLPYENFYYTLEDILFDEAAKGTFTYSVHRPSIIFGFSPYSRVNFIVTLCVYASICKHIGMKLIYPGTKKTWESYWDGSDADLIAEQEIWAAVDSNAKNEAFNCSNGDVYKMKQLWKILAEEFKLEYDDVGDGSEGIRVSEAMKGKERVWDEIVKANELEVNELGSLANWIAMDFAFNTEPIMACMNKSKEYGFFGFRNSRTSFVYWIDKLKASKIVP